MMSRAFYIKYRSVSDKKKWIEMSEEIKETRHVLRNKG